MTQASMAGGGLDWLRVRRAAGWAVCGLALVVMLSNWLVILLVGQLAWSELLQNVLFDVLALGSTALAALILARHPGHLIGWLLMIQGAHSILAAPITGYLNRLPAPPADPGPLFLIILILDNLSWLAFIFPLLFIPLYFPTGRLPSRRWAFAPALGLGMCLLLTILTVLSQRLGPIEGNWTVPNPIGFIPDSFMEVYFILPWSMGLIGLAVSSLTSVVLRYRRGSPLERQQIKWLLLGCAAFTAIYAPTVILVNFAGTGWTELGFIQNVLFALGVLAIPVSMSIAILRHRLFDVDLIIRRTLAYSVLTGVLALVYFGSVVVLQGILRGVIGGDSQVAIVLSTLLIAALFVPLRARVQAVIDRRLYRSKYNAARTLAAFGAALRDETDLARLSERLVSVVDETMQPASVGLWLTKQAATPARRSGVAPMTDEHGAPGSGLAA